MKHIDSTSDDFKFPYKWTFFYCALAIAIQILIPILITLANIPRAGSVIGVVCPLKHEEWSMDSFSVHLAGYLVCLLNLLSFWGDVRNKSLVFEFMSQCTFKKFDIETPDTTGKLEFSPEIHDVSEPDKMNDAEGSRRPRRESFTFVHQNLFHCMLLSLVAGVQEFSCA